LIVGYNYLIVAVQHGKGVESNGVLSFFVDCDDESVIMSDADMFFGNYNGRLLTFCLFYEYESALA